jgi:hypothetical protein
MRPAGLLVLALASILVAAAAAEAPTPRPVTAADRQQAVGELARLLRERYAIVGTAETAAAAIEQRLAAGRYDAFGDARSFADALTRDLQEVTGDRHLRVGEAPPAEPATATPSAAERDAEQEAWRAGVRRGNNGFLRAEILPGNVGYLDYRRFQPPDLAGDTLVATMAFLANADALIFDLRNCRGGSAYTTPYVAAYFFDRSTQLFTMEFRGDNFTERYWTHPWVPGKRLATIPLYITTSAYTFSGAEAMAYRFKALKRATIVGERTGGGANAGGVRDVAPFFRVYLPMGRPIEPVTGTNLEGVGVEPDVAASANEAVAVAHLEALKGLRAAAATDADRERLDWAIRRAKASRRPVTLDAAQLERLAGRWGPGRTWVEGGQLRWQRETEGVLLLSPLTATEFYAEALDPTRLEFVLGPDGVAERLVFTDDDGRREEFVKER